MSSIILLGTYIGLSDFVFDVKCNGLPLEESEAQKIGLINDDTIRRHSQSNYTRDWYKVNPGDQIEIRWRDDEHDIKTTFIIPERLVDPPQNPDDEKTGMRLYDYLEANCKRIK